MTRILLVTGPRADDNRRVGEGLQRLGLGTGLSMQGREAPAPGGALDELNLRLLRLFHFPTATSRIGVASLPPALAEWFADEALRLTAGDGEGFLIVVSTALERTLPFWRQVLRPIGCLLVVRQDVPSAFEPSADDVFSLDLATGHSTGEARLVEFREWLARIGGAEVSPGAVFDEFGPLFHTPDVGTAGPCSGEKPAEYPETPAADTGARIDWARAVELAREPGPMGEGFARALTLALEEKDVADRALQDELDRRARASSQQPRQLSRLRLREQNLDTQLKIERKWRHDLRRDPAFRLFARLPGKHRWTAEPGLELTEGSVNAQFSGVARHSKNRDVSKLESGLDALRRAIWNRPWPWPSAEEDLALAPSPREVDFWLELRDTIAARPLFSILLPVHRVKPEILRATIQSVFDQVYDRWELCVAVDGAAGPESLGVIEAFRERFPERFKLVPVEGVPGIAGSTNRAADVAEGDFVVFLDHDDRLTPDALLLAARYLDRNPEADLVYSDEDCIDEEGNLGLVLRKPDFSPELLLSCNYIIHMVCVRRTLFERIGRIREGYDYSQDYDLLLRATEQAEHVGHLPEVLYHWRMHRESSTHDPLTRKKQSREPSQRALQDAMNRRGCPARVERGTETDAYRVRFEVDPDSRVSIIVADAEDVMSLRTCVRSVRLKTGFQNFEIVVVTTPETDAELSGYLDQVATGGEIRRLECETAGGIPARSNFAARHCDSPFLVFLSARTEVTDPDWLSALLEHVQRPEIGVVGGQLNSSGGSVKQAGVFFGRNGMPGFAFRNLPAEYSGPFSMNRNVRNCMAVTGCCMAIRREAFLDLNGFDEEFAGRFHDLDLCLRLIDAGRRNVYTPFSKLVIHESEDASVGFGAGPDLDRLRARWEAMGISDPYFLPEMDAGNAGERQA